MKKLEELGFIKLKEQFYVKCVDLLDDEYTELTEDQKNCRGIGVIGISAEFTECNRCNRMIRLQNKKILNSYTIKIDCYNLRSYLIGKISSYSETEISGNSHIICKNNNKNHKICFLDLCQDIECKTSFYYGDDILFTYCDYNEKIKGENVIWIIDLLKMTDSDVVNLILSQAPANKIETIEGVMNDYIDNITEYQFEKLMIELLNYIRSHPKDLNIGKSFLKKYSSSIVGSFAFKIGGAGKSDGRIINLNDYFEAPLKTDISIESKHSNISNYSKTEITHLDIKQLITQSYEDQAVLFSNRERIGGSSLDELFRYRQKAGFWKYVVINRPLLKLFISLFASEFWNDPDCLKVT